MRLASLAAVAAALVALAAAGLPASAAGSHRRSLSQAPPDASAPASAPASSPIYFPLLSSNLTSRWPAGAFSGYGYGVTWEDDPLFGPVLTCSQESRSYVSIPGLQYGQAGPFGLAIWAKLRPEGNVSFDYLYSHANLGMVEFGFDPNQVALFLPERNHPAFGVVRAILRDSTDVLTNGTGKDPMYVDSNGCVADAACSAPSNASSLFSPEGAWHLLGLTTHPEGGKGFLLYVDGQLAAAVTEGEQYTDSQGFVKTATGGAPMNLTGNITLCARSDLDRERFFTGSLAHLFIWNRSVTADEMSQLYGNGPLQQQQQGSATVAGTGSAGTASSQLPPKGCTTPCEDYGSGLLMCRTGTGSLVRCTGGSTSASTPGAGAGQAAGAPSSSPDPAAGMVPDPECITPCQDAGGFSLCYDAGGQPLFCNPAAASPAPGSPAPGSADPSRTGAVPDVLSPLPSPSPAPAAAPASPQAGPDQALVFGGLPLCSPAPIQGIPTAQDCGAGAVCAALSAQLIADGLGSLPQLATGGVGVCAQALDPPMPNATQLPVPVAFFPLDAPALQSWPLPQWGAVSSASAGIVRDPLFGTSLQCTDSDRDLVGLDSFQYASASGAFSVNLWFLPGNMSGEGMAHLFSHRGTDANSTAQSNTGGQPNQIQIFLPRQEHLAYGVVRAIVKDSTDNETELDLQTFLDSDGTVSFPAGPRRIPEATSVFNGSWHMVTVTTQPGGNSSSNPKGFRLYVDGRLVNSLEEGTGYQTSQGFDLPVTGGDPILLDGNPVLCSRSDSPEGRHYDGQLAYLSLFDSALTEDQVGLLYSTVAGRMGGLPPPASAPVMGLEVPVANPPAAENGTSRVAMSGKPCQFPALLNGDVVTDCTLVSGVMSCQVAEGDWEPCDMGGAPAPAPEAGALLDASGQQLTSDGDVCIFPARFEGQNVTDCTVIKEGGSPMCQTATGAWKECAGMHLSVQPLPPSSLNDTSPGSPPAAAGSDLNTTGSSRAPVTTLKGDRCQLPLQYHGVTVDSCVGIMGQYLCWMEQGQSWDGCPENVTTAKASAAALGLGAGAVIFPTVPVRNRKAVDGSPCTLPIVFEGELLDDCVQINGTWSCLDSNRLWKACDTSAGAPPPEQPGQLLVAERYSASGKPCLLPAVANGYLLFDCAQGGDSAAGTCPTQNGAWEPCADAEMLTPNMTAPKPVSAATVLDRSVPGTVGMLCALPPISGQPNADCASNLTCVPLPELSRTTNTSLSGLGTCAPNPVGGTKGSLLYLAEAGAPVPLAFFPLTAGSLDSLLLPAYSGAPNGAPLPGWVPDPVYSSIVNCSRASQDSLVMDTVPYAANGSFAVSLWMRRLPGSNYTGSAFSYLLSHVGPGQIDDVGSPNRVSIYLPDRDHAAFGVVRVILTDASDRSTALVFVDSDGKVGSDEPGRKPKHADLHDGSWHMITVSTLPDRQGAKGFALFVDGAQVGVLRTGTQTSSGSQALVTGGYPAELNSSIYICSRHDQDVQRYFDGSVAHLALFNRALTPPQVAGLYQAYYASKATSKPLDASAAAPDPAASSASGGLSTGEITGIVFASIGGAMALATLGVLAVAAARRRTKTKNFERFDDDPTAAAAAPATVTQLGREVSRGSSMAAPLAGQLSIQLSSGKSMSLGGMEPMPSWRSDALSEVSTAAPSTITGGLSSLPRLPAGASGLPLLPGNGNGGPAGSPPATPGGVSRVPTAHSGTPLLPGTGSGLGSAGGAATPRQPSFPPSESAFASAASERGAGSEGGGSFVSARSTGAGSDVTIEPGRRGLFRSGGARVVLPKVQEDPRSPFEP